MNPLRPLLATCLFAAVACMSPVQARECSTTVKDGWVRLPPVSMPMMAGFGRIENPCAAPVTIVGASSPAFGEVSLHETRVVDGMSRMRHLPELRIESEGTATLKPGGLHLMLMQPRAPLKEGSTVVIEFALKDGGVLRGEFIVRKPGA